MARKNDAVQYQPVSGVANFFEVFPLSERFYLIGHLHHTTTAAIPGTEGSQFPLQLPLSLSLSLNNSLIPASSDVKEGFLAITPISAVFSSYLFNSNLDTLTITLQILPRNIQ